MADDEDHDILQNLAKPVTDATITVRVIKSFEYRTEKSLVLHHLNLQESTVAKLKELVLKGVMSLTMASIILPMNPFPGWLEIQAYSAWRPYRTSKLGVC